MATLEQIQAKLKKLQAQAEVMLAKKAQAAVDQIRVLMLEHGLTTADIETKAKLKREAKNITRGSAGIKTKGEPKYLHPKTGATWSGHGRAPAWIVESKDRTKFLIAPDTVVAASENLSGKAKTPTAKSTVATGSPARKGQPKGPQPAVYRDPKSGATWSGRGRAPAWIGANRSKFLIDGTVAEPKEIGAGFTAKPKLGRANKAAVKKSAAKKVVAKGAATNNVATVKKSTAANVPARRVAAAPSAKKAIAEKGAGRKAAAKKVATTAEVASVPEFAANETAI